MSFEAQVASLVLLSENIESDCGDASASNVELLENDAGIELDRSRLRCRYDNLPQLQQRIVDSLSVIDKAFRDYGCVYFSLSLSRRTFVHIVDVVKR